MSEYEVRKNISEAVTNHINNQIDLYYKKYSNNLGFLVYYPLIRLEAIFTEEEPYFRNSIIGRDVLSWFLSKIFKLKFDDTLKFKFNQEEYNDFCKLYPKIESLYNDYINANEVMDTFSIAKWYLKSINDQECEIIKTHVESNIYKERVYNSGIFNKEEREIEEKKGQEIVDYLIKTYSVKSVRKLQNIEDKKLLFLCEEKVSMDIEKLGEKINSNVIDDRSELIKFISFLFYISQIYRCSSMAQRVKNSNILDISETYIYVDLDWLINKIHKVQGIKREVIEKYIKYFTFSEKLNLNEFPLVIIGKKVFFIPSSFILNDFHFSIVNGHYQKVIPFPHRDKSISASVINDLEKKVSKFDNIIFCKEKYYEFYESDQKQISDIDFGLYDLNSNSALIIECKWIDNHYSYDSILKEDYIKVQRTLNTIFNKQISKHKKYLSDKKNLLKIFDNNPDIPENADCDIFYLAVDKRVQLYIKSEEKYLTTIYILLWFFEQFSKDNTLLLKDMIDKFRSFETKAIYEPLDNPRKFQIGNNLIVYSDQLKLVKF